MTSVFEHVIVPVDGSSTAERGIALALELTAGGGSITFCSVVDPTVLCVPAAEVGGLDFGPLLTVLDEDAETFCRDAQAKSDAAGVKSDTIVLHGQCVSVIEQLVRDNRCDAVVLGTHARTGLDRMVLGSVTEGLLRAIDAPIVVAHQDDEARTGPVLVAVDDSPAAAAAVKEAIVIAASRGNALALVHVLNPDHPDAAAANAALERAAHEARERGLAVSLMLRRGDPCDELIAAADALESCMIVMGTHGRSLVPRLVLGSVAAAVVERARVPVMTIRRSGRVYRPASVSLAQAVTGIHA
jgi:nucleotide-binding universal stress UspA family protein